MTATISDGATNFEPLMVVGWESTREAGNVIHDIINRPDDDVTYRPARYRSGTLTVLCATLEDAITLEALVSQPKKLTLTEDTRPALNMAFVVEGDITVTLEEETREEATVAIEFRQVAP